MKHFSIILFFTVFACSVYGQKIYRAEREAYKINKVVYEFYLSVDSTCFLKKHNIDNSSYSIYKGHLKRIKDTLYEFKFKPIVEFTCNMRMPYKDSVDFYITEIDTTITSLVFAAQFENGTSIIVKPKTGRSGFVIKGSDKQKFLIDTKFVDPLTKKNIYYTNTIHSEPDFTYYGSKTDLGSVKISIMKSKLTIYPDHKYIWDKDAFILTK